jgi:hypothetical protein
MIPLSLRQRWHVDVVCAEAHAAMDEVAAGYERLCFGLRAAELDLKRGLPWAEALIDRYRQSLTEYQTSYGLPNE